MKTLLTTAMALGVIMTLESSQPVSAANQYAAPLNQQGQIAQAGYYYSPGYYYAPDYYYGPSYYYGPGYYHREGIIPHILNNLF